MKYTVTMVMYVDCEVSASSPEEAEDLIRESPKKYVEEAIRHKHYSISDEGDITVQPK